MIRICVDADGPGIIFPVMYSERIVDPTICLRCETKLFVSSYSLILREDEIGVKG